MLKILSDKFTVDGRDGTIDKLLGCFCVDISRIFRVIAQHIGGLCLIAGLSEETDEHSIGELWHRIEKVTGPNQKMHYLDTLRVDAIGYRKKIAENGV